jgi:hypothetical protein
MNKPSQAGLKIKMMKRSTSCLALGVASLLPVVGVCFAVAAYYDSYMARRNEKQFWNPARSHRVIGLILAAFGGLVWGAIDTIIIFHLMNPTP